MKEIIYFDKSFTFPDIKANFLKRIGLLDEDTQYLSHEALDTLKVVKATERLVRGSGGCFGYWEDEQWPEPKKGYRTIPHLPRYCVNRSGEVYDLKNDTVLPNGFSGGYKNVSVRCEMHKRMLSLSVHRAIGFTWVKNENPEKYWLARHLDDDRDNHELSNLAWGDFLLNAKDSIDNGKFPNSKLVIAKRWDSDKPKVFPTIASFAKYIGLGQEALYVRISRYPNRPVLGVWEIKIGDIKRAAEKWNLTHPMPDRPSPYLYFVDGFCLGSDKAVMEHFGMKYVNGVSSGEHLDRVFKQTGKRVRVEPNKLFHSREIECYDRTKDKIVDAKTILGGSTYSGLNQGTVKKLLVKGSNFAKRGFSFRVKTGEPWSKEYSDITYSHENKIKFTAADGTEFIYNSIKHASRETKINEKAITRHLKSGEVYNGFVITKV